MQRKPLTGILAFGLMANAAVFADSISPTSFSDTIGPSGTTTVRKTVTVTKGRPTSSLVDVFFLADTTGSMGSAIASVRTAASSIMTTTAGLGNVQFGVGEYKDVGDVFVYRRNQDLTANQALVQAGINAWVASGGGDFPEANFFGLKQVADTTSWRAGSRRILAWFGDAPSHDPSNGVSEAQATAALVGKGIQVEAVNVAGAGAGIDQGGQATRIKNATGGHLYNGVAGNNVATAIQNAIDTAFDTYKTVSLDLSEVPAGLSAALVPLSYVGVYDRSIDRTFEFELTFKCEVPGDYSFNVYATVDGGRVATEADRIDCHDDRVPDAGSSIMLLGLGVLGLVGLSRKVAA